jgi:FG-GAP-like repeat
MMAPVVIQLDDDSCDGEINERDIPEIVFLTFAGGDYLNNGTIHAISIVNGSVVEKWSRNAGAVSPNHPVLGIAAGNFDGQPGNEVAVCTTDGRVRAYSGAGDELWLSAPSSCALPILADLDQDGHVEVITESQILDGATGATIKTFSNQGGVTAYDMNGDGRLDLVGTAAILQADGVTDIARLPFSNDYKFFFAIGDLDRDGTPEVVVANVLKHTIDVWHYKAGVMGNAEYVRQDIDINATLSPELCPDGYAGRSYGGGAPTIADFNGDGFPDVAIAGGVGYAVFDGVKLMNPSVANNQTNLWIAQTQDCSSAQTGSSVFDFNGDGKAEVVYADELKLRVYNGTDGNLLYSTCNTNGTAYEYPLVADVDNDGQADIVAVSNNYSGFNCNGEQTTGVRIFGAANNDWVRTRSVWNQHTYHVTNVSESGAIPAIEPSNHTQPRLNNFRQNVQPLGEFSAPDLIASLDVRCGTDSTVIATVRNLGSAAVSKDIPIAFYLGDPNNGGIELPGSPVRTKYRLLSTEAEQVKLTLAQPLPENQTVYVVVDPGAAHSWQECRVDNNTASSSTNCRVE